MDAALAIVVAAIISGAGPLLLNWQTGRRRARERAEDFARQDKVARKVEEVAIAATVASEHAVKTANEVKNMTGAITKVIENTNGMSHRLEQLAGQAGEARGREQAEKAYKNE